MRIAELKNKNRINEIVDIHMQSFNGFFLTFLGRGFLKQLYMGFLEHPNSGLIAAVDDSNKIVGFLAYSGDFSGFYKYLLKKRLILFAWYAGWAFLRKPKIILRLLRAFTSSAKAKRTEAYVELASIGVLPKIKGTGTGSKMIAALKKKVTSLNYKHYEYIKLETDAVNNEVANRFYQKNGFILDHEYETFEKRKMNEYRYYLKPSAEK